MNNGSATEPSSTDSAATSVRRVSVADYLSLVRFSHTVFALPFALLAALLAWHDVPFQWIHLVGILAAMVTARTAAMAFNRLVDHRLDAANPRTAGRHLPAGILTPRQVGSLVLGSSVLFVASTLLFLPNVWPLALSIPVLIWLCGYSYAKRFTSLAHYWLGIALGLAPIAAWLAITGSVTATPLWIAALIVSWVGGFDILYACQDEEYDRSVDLHSIPAALGRSRAFWVARLSHAVTVVALVGLADAAAMGTTFWIAVAVVALLLLIEHCLVSPDDLSRVNTAFFSVNAVISFGILAAAGLDVLIESF